MENWRRHQTQLRWTHEWQHRIPDSATAVTTDFSQFKHLFQNSVSFSGYSKSEVSFPIDCLLVF
jgi:hypothetical protein